MSYSNDWRISNITGISSLRDCYKSNGISILENVGCPRLEDSQNLSDSITIQETPKRTYTDFKHYIIPKYLITNKSISAYGDTVKSNPLLNTNYVYQTGITYKSGYVRTQTKWWNFELVPVVFFDDLTDYSGKTDDFEITRIGNIKCNNKIYWADNVKSVYRITEPFLQITQSRTNIYTKSYFTKLRGTGKYTTNFLYYTGSSFSTRKYTGSNYSRYNVSMFGIWLNYEHLFHTDKKNLEYSLLYGEQLDTTYFETNIITSTDWEVYSFGIGNGDFSTHSPYVDIGGNIDYISNPVYDYNFNSLFYIGDYSISGTHVSDPCFKSGNYWYLQTWGQAIYSKYNYDYASSGTVLQSIHIIAPQYRWLFNTVNDYTYDGVNLTSVKHFGVPYYNNGSLQNVPRVKRFSSVTASRRSSTETDDHATFSSCYWNNDTISHENNVTFSSNSGLGYSRDYILFPGAYTSDVSLNFPYDNSSFTSPIKINTQDFLTHNTFSTFLNNKRVCWKGEQYHADESAPSAMHHGIITDSSTSNHYLFVWEGGSASDGSCSQYAIDFSLNLANKGTGKQRSAIVGFCKEHCWLEPLNIGGHTEYQLKGYNNFSDYPKGCPIVMSIQGSSYTVLINFGEYEQVRTDINGVTLPVGYINVQGSTIDFIVNGISVGFENGYISLIGVYMENVSFDIVISPGEFDENTYYFVNDTGIELTCDITWIIRNDSSGQYSVNTKSEDVQTGNRIYITAENTRYETLEWIEVVYRDINGQTTYTKTYGTKPIENVTISSHVTANNSNYNPDGISFHGVSEYAEYYQLTNFPNNYTALLVTFNGVSYVLRPTSWYYELYNDYSGGRSIYSRLCFDTTTNRIYVFDYDSGDPAEEDWDSYDYGSGFTISEVIAIL